MKKSRIPLRVRIIIQESKDPKSPPIFVHKVTNVKLLINLLDKIAEVKYIIKEWTFEVILKSINSADLELIKQNVELRGYEEYQAVSYKETIIHVLYWLETTYVVLQPQTKKIICTSV